MLATSTAKTTGYLDPKTRSSEVLEFESELRKGLLDRRMRSDAAICAPVHPASEAVSSSRRD